MFIIHSYNKRQFTGGSISQENQRFGIFHMGAVSSASFTPEELEEYVAVTCLSRSEIVDLYDRFTALGGARATAGGAAQTGESTSTGDVEGAGKTIETAEQKVKLSALLKTDELKNNPFGRR